MEPIVLFGVIILIFGLWQEFGPIIQRVCNAISNCHCVIKLASALKEESPSYEVNVWLDRKAG